MYKFNGDYYTLVETITRGAINNNLTPKESFIKFIDLVSLESILETLENANKTVEDLYKDVHPKN